jgi:hypothetical protein
MGPRLWFVGTLLLTINGVSTIPAQAQGNYEIQVYSYDTVEPGYTMVELHSNFTIDGSKTVQDGVLPTNHAEHESIEITHGFNDWSRWASTSLLPRGAGKACNGSATTLPARVHPQEMELALGASLSNEIGYQRRKFSVHTWTWEIRPIADKQIGRWYFSLNPTLDRSFHGASVHQGVVFSQNFKFSYDFTEKITGGLEYYGSVGPVTGFSLLNQQQHQIFPAIDLNLSPKWEVNLGLGVGVTRSTDHLIAKMILGYRFDF